MAFTKHAALENVQILELKGSRTKARHASLGKLADFENYRTDDGYLYARVRAISSRVNKNHDGWPSVELAGGQDVFDKHTAATGFTVAAERGRKYGFSTFLGKPIFVDHHNSDPDRARGVIVDAKLHVDDHKTASLDPYYSSSEVDPEHLPATWVELLLEVDAKSFPKFAKAIVEGSRNPNKGIDGWSMGCDVERSECSICKNSASSPDEYCKHVKLKGAYFDWTDDHGQKMSKLAYENCYGVGFFELSGVFDPADATALSLEQARTAAYHDPKLKDLKEESLKDEADKLNDEWAVETEEGIKRRKPKKAGAHHGDEYDYTCPHCGHGDNTAGGPLPSACPQCGISGYTMWNDDPDLNGYFTDPDQKATAAEAYQQQQGGGLAQLEHQFQLPDAEHPLGPHAGAVKHAENPLPQVDMYHAPEQVDTLREEQICPVCGSSMDEDTCDVCGYQEPPEGFGNPDLDKAKQVDDEPEKPEGEAGAEAEPQQIQSEPQAVNTPNNPTALAHVTSSMDWDVHTPKTSARINKTERPIVATDKPATNEPTEKIISDQLQPVTSNVRTAEDFIARAGARRNMETHTADAASGAPAVAKPDVKTDVTGVGGVDQASNDAASKADAQVDVTGIGGTGVESVGAEQEGVNVEQGDEHSKNIEAIHTDTWSTQERQHTPVTREPFPAHADGVHATSHWVVEGHEDGTLEGQEQQGGYTWGNPPGSAVQGVKPIAEQFGERVNVLEHSTSPSNNSGPTTTWTGTDGNGVTKQQDPVTNESIALSESGLEGKPNWSTSSHVFAAFKLARLETSLGMISADQEFDRAAELEHYTPDRLAASLEYAQRVRQSARKRASVQRLPVMGQQSVEKTASTEPTVHEDAEFMFGGI